MYLAVLDVAISVVLLKESEDGGQRPVFFVSISLADVETRYSHLEQAALALRIAAKKLRSYFQPHPVMVLNNLILRSTIHKFPKTCSSSSNWWTLSVDPGHVIPLSRGSC